MKPQCGGCRFFKNLPDHPEGRYLLGLGESRYVEQFETVGECRVHAPTITGGDRYDSDYALRIWPLVYSEDWCGLFAVPEGSR